jgi:hypothetical protein
MSTFQAIAAVSKYLRQEIRQGLLDDQMIKDDQKIVVTVGPPDKAREGRKDAQLNLFLYQIAPDAAWRNRDLPGRVKPGESAPPVLAIRLNYLLTAFGGEDDTLGTHQDDLVAHQLLGSAMRRLHDRPELPRELENAVGLNRFPVPQPEPPRVTLQPLTPDEVTRVWSGLQSPCRLSVAYEVAPVLIESARPTRSAPPVLSRGDAPGPGGTPADPGFPATPSAPPATITALRFPPGQAGVRLGDTLRVEGTGLDRVNLLELRHPTLPIVKVAEPTYDPATKELTWAVPDDPAGWPAGLWTLAVARAPDPADPVRREFTSEAVAMPLLPEIVLAAGTHPRLVAERDGTGAVVRVSVRLRLRPAARATTDGFLQKLGLFAGPRDLPLRATVPAGVPVAATGGEGDPVAEVVFVEDDPAAAAALYAALQQIPADQPPFVRVRVDGADSSLLKLPFDPKADRREYDPNLTLEVP